MKIFDRGQVSAPFELLVAIIIMTFVIIVGTTMLSSVNEQVCMNHVEKSMSEFVTFLEETANKKSTNRFVFYPQAVCFNESEATMKIVRERSSNVCSAKCGIPQNTCYVMIFHAADIALGYKEKCINLPVYTNFATDPATCPTTGDLAGFEVNPDVPGESMPFGTYVLKNVAAAGETWPNICFYYKR